MLTVEPPAAMHGAALIGELRAAGLDVPDHGITFDPPVLHVEGAAEADRATVEQVVADHTPPEPAPDPDAELDAGLAEVAARTDVPEWGQALIANLRGQAGREGRAAGRPA